MWGWWVTRIALVPPSWTPGRTEANRLADDMMVPMRANKTDALDIGEVSIPVFRLMLERSYLPAELFSSLLDGTEPRGE
jgi:hypothetical protein